MALPEHASLNDLHGFVAVARTRNFRKAAAELGVSPSALSHALRGLETRLGVRLLNRTTRSVAPTEAGERLLARLTPALGEIAEALGGSISLENRIERGRTAGLDATTEAVRRARVAGPHAGAQAVGGVVRDRDPVVEAVEAGHRHDRAEDLLLEDPHPVVALEDGGLDVEAAIAPAAALSVLRKH